MPRLKKYAKPSSLIFFCAFRYALGRATYIVKSVTDEIIHNIDLIETNDLRLMAKEIREAIKEKRAGFDCDIAEWMKLAKRVDYELEDRAEDI